MLRESIRSALGELRRQEPGIRLRDAAARLAVSELELLLAHTGSGAITLRSGWEAMLRELPALGSIMALTRNESVVIENHGAYENVDPRSGVVLGAQIDLRLFLDKWRHAIALADDESTGFKRSLQFFDASGTAVHKIFRTEATDGAAFDALVARWAAPASDLAQVAGNEPSPVRAAFDQHALRTKWAAMRDTHDVFPLLKQLGIDRLTALRALGSEFALPLPAASLRKALTRAVDSGVPLMFFVSNPGAIQIYTGTIENVQILGTWVNVLDRHFNLHVQEQTLANAWIVRRPTADGTVTSLDYFDATGELVLQIFGKRKPGDSELEAWRTLVASLERD